MHVAIIMDGNGRWAQLRGLPRTIGHHAGARTVRRIVEAAAQLPVDILTLYAFSSDNWARPGPEVRGLMGLMQRYLRSETSRCVKNGVEVRFIGRRDRFDAELRGLIETAETHTRGGKALTLRIAADYSSRCQILAAAKRFRELDVSDADTFGRLVAGDPDSCAPGQNVDLLIRTGGERRLSDFLLWECAYAEFVFVDNFWPDFDAQALEGALAQFAERDRRFGCVHDEAAAASRSELP